MIFFLDYSLPQITENGIGNALDTIIACARKMSPNFVKEFFIVLSFL